MVWIERQLDNSFLCVFCWYVRSKNQHDALLYSQFISLINLYIFFYVLLNVHLSIFILVINQLDAQNFTTSLFHASTCFEHMCSLSGGQNCILLLCAHSYIS